MTLANMANIPIKSVLGAAAVIAAAQSCGKMPEKPNVIVILADDLGYGDLSCYGAERVSTPNVDALASAGIRFTNAHCCASTSTPSRYALLTGSYPFRRTGTDIADGNAGMIIRPEQYTLADVFHDAGYATGAFGKWHLGLGSETAMQDWNGELDMTPKDLGFDYHYIMAATADRVPCVFIENGKVDNWDPDAPIEVRYDKPFEGEPLASTNPELLTKLVHSHGHDMTVVNGIGRIGYMKGGGKALWKDENIADSITVHAVDFIKSHKGSPFFMYICTNDIHVPRYPHDRFRGKSPMGLRGEAVLQFDWTVGQVMAALREQGLDKNTIVILTSDNGPVLDDGYQDKAMELCGDHRPGGPFRGGKYSAFEAGNTVPFIVYLPEGMKHKSASNALVSQIDFVASMAALTGVEVPDGMASDSRDSHLTWLGKNETDRDFVVSMALNRSLEIRDAEWKYIEPSKGTKFFRLTSIESGYSLDPQLYHLTEDSGEQGNVAAEYPEKVEEMKNRLEEVRIANF
ncbi:MAG: sulfatase-like hydrolase/transferase [Candidatus Cryptobacteroides sp.]